MSCENNNEAIDTQRKKSNIEYSGIDSDGGVLELKILNENKSFLKLKTTKKVTFYRNLDDDLVHFPEKIDTNFSLSTYFETVDGKIQFDFGYFIGENCFQKN